MEMLWSCCIERILPESRSVSIAAVASFVDMMRRLCGMGITVAYRGKLAELARIEDSASDKGHTLSPNGRFRKKQGQRILQPLDNGVAKDRANSAIKDTMVERKG